MRLAAIILLLLPVLHAHPLDDQAQMASEVVLVSDSSIELVLDFRYVSVLASLSEFSNGLDANGDGIITRRERDRRFEALVLEMAFAFSVRVDGGEIMLTPLYDRFELNNMDNPAALDFTAGVETDSLRIHYRLIFGWEGRLAPGEHTVEYVYSGVQSVVHTPAQQMIAFDARVIPRERMNNVRHDKVHGTFPRLTLGWIVPEPLRPEAPTAAAAPEITTGPSGVGELPAWLTLIAGVCVALAGLAGGAFNAARRRGRALMTSLLLLVAGSAIVLGACVRLGLVTPFA